MDAVKSQTISQILEATLDIGREQSCQKDESVLSSSRDSTSAAKTLLAEKQKRKELMAEDFIALGATTKSAVVANPFFSQIASSKSDIQPPTYWKSAPPKKSNNQPIGKAKKAKLLKGEEYKDKHMHKNASKQSRKDRLLHLKHL
jgi:hypothetical protein